MGMGDFLSEKKREEEKLKAKFKKIDKIDVGEIDEEAKLRETVDPYRSTDSASDFRLK